LAGEDYLRLVNIVPDNTSHIAVKDRKRCKRCNTRACLYVCPSGVFYWNESSATLEILWRRCVECSACENTCPENIAFRYPRGGFGITYYM